MSAPPAPLRTFSLVRKIFVALCAFIYWSFFAIMDAIFQPLAGLANPLIASPQTSENLAESIWYEIITSYFSLFTISQLFLLLLWYALIHSLRTGLWDLVSPRSMAGTRKKKLFAIASIPPKFNINDIAEMNKVGDYQFSKPTFSPAVIAVPDQLAVIAEDWEGNTHVLIGGQSQPVLYTMEIGGKWIAIFPLQSIKMTIHIGSPQPNDYSIKERYSLSYGFPRKSLEGGSIFDPDTLRKIAARSDYSTWKRLVELFILTSMAEFGFSIKQRKSTEWKFIHLENPLTSQINSAADSNPSTVMKKKSAFLINTLPGKKFSAKGTPSFRRNRKFAQSPPPALSIAHSISLQQEIKTKKSVDPQDLQSQINNFVKFQMQRLYYCPAVEIEIMER
jgi:hypothetical protein